MAKTPSNDPAASARSKAEKQTFKVTRDVLHDGELVSDGEPIELTKSQHTALFGVGAIAEEGRG
jgi:hypothetical protein